MSPLLSMLTVKLQFSSSQQNLIQSTCTVESCDYTPFSACQHWAKLGRGLIRGIVTFLYDDHYRPMKATWVSNLCTFSSCLMGKTQQKRQSKAYYQLVCQLQLLLLLAYGLQYLHFILREGEGLYARKIKIRMQELKLKVQGAYAQGGRNCRILWYKQLSVVQLMALFTEHNLLTP